jgi:DNA-binding transcriptional LysR family regulator
VIDPRSVEVFYWVVVLGGFRRAAEKLATTQPAVSARVAGLEAALGARLLDRGQRRRISPTPAGLQLMAYAERLLALQDEMRAAFLAPAALRGTVRLGVAETIVHTWLGTLVQRLHEAYPLIELDIVVEISAVLRASLLAGEVDVALLLGPVAAAGVRDLPLDEHPLGWIARPGLLPAGRLGLDVLSRHPIITYARQTAPYQQVRDLFGNRTREGGAAPRIFANASLASIVRMVLDGIGIGVIAPGAIQVELDSGALILLDAEPVLAPLRFTASWRETAGSGLAAAVARLAMDVATHQPRPSL